MDVSEGTDNMIELRILKKDNLKVVLRWRGANDMSTVGPNALQENGRAPWYTSDVLPENEAVKWGDILYFQWEDVSASGNDDFTSNSLGSRAYSAEEKKQQLQKYDLTEQAGWVLKNGNGPRNITIYPTPVKTFADRVGQLISDEEYNMARVLIEHVVYNQAYYKRVLDRAKLPGAYATLLEALKLGTCSSTPSLLP